MVMVAGDTVVVIGPSSFVGEPYRRETGEFSGGRRRVEV
jgi:hypothetical protein